MPEAPEVQAAAWCAAGLMPEAPEVPTPALLGALQGFLVCLKIIFWNFVPVARSVDAY